MSTVLVLTGNDVAHPKAGAGSREVLGREASGEFVFAVVGHAGSGTTAIATNPDYSRLFSRLGWRSFIAGIALAALIPMLRRLIGGKEEVRSTKEQAEIVNDALTPGAISQTRRVRVVARKIAGSVDHRFGVQRQEEVRRVAPQLVSKKAWRRDPHDGEWHIVKRDGLSNDCWICAKPPFPKTVTDHDNRLSIAHLIV